MEHTTILDLGGKWRVHSKDGKYRFEGQVPGSVFFDLEKKGAFGPKGLFWREANRAAPAVADRVFIYERTFKIPAGFPAGSFVRQTLECEGLDTLAEVRVNGTLVGKADNMHRSWAFPVDGLLKAGENRIQIAFDNTLAFIAKGKKRRDLFDGGGGVETMKGFNHIRKNSCSYGWDWGPQVPDVGIWRPIRLTARAHARLDSVRVQQVHRKGAVSLSISPELTAWSEIPLTFSAVLTAPDGKKTGIHGEIEPNTAAGPFRMEIRNPELWWPHGLGAQPLYRLECEVRTHGGDLLGSRALDLGLRTVAVDRSPDRHGEAFTFVVNGVPIFARGGDYIPEDVFLNRPDRAATESLLKQAVAANYNCVRVWGGGVYPVDDFYDLCDRMGLLVWQDLMFACALYPMDDPRFRASIAAEVRDNLVRIRHHACLGLVCGNNEMEWAFEEWNMKGAGKRERREYLEQYQALFPAIAGEACPDVHYWPASPSSGGDFEAPNDANKGDVHFWKVWHGRAPFEEYTKHHFRFLSEFGFESFPSIKTIEAFTEPGDRNVFSPVMEDHQRCAGGNGTILYYVSQHLRYPKDFASLVYASQVIQAEAMRTGIEHMRRNRGRCMGSVYWQFNDNWPVASWASIDYHGRWKALHYLARRIYDNVLVSSVVDGKTAEIHLSNEGREGVAGELRWSLVSLAGRTLRKGRKALAAGALSSKAALRLDFTRELADGMEREAALVYGFYGKKGAVCHGSAFFTRSKFLSLEDPGLRVKVSEAKGRVRIDVKARSFARFVWLDLKKADVVFSDNYFDLAAGETRTVWVEQNPSALAASRIRSELTCISLFDSFES
ncbi:MAG: glycoside hydrolase family 2 protein [Spirochaetes bacterium]|nr:glycoside hydrolase family 2 protein [Spirochaetota bacterium]